MITTFLASIAFATPLHFAPQIIHVAQSGNDADSGLSPTDAVRTIQRGAQLANPGATVLIGAGTYREVVIPPRNGTINQPITFRPATDAKVTVSGTELVSGWTPTLSAGVFTAKLGSAFVSAINQSDQIFVDGNQVNLAQWPEPAKRFSFPSKASITKFISKTRDRAQNMTTAIFEDDRLEPKTDGYYVGADIQMQPNYKGWSWAFSGKVIAQKGNRLTIESRSDSGKDGSQERYEVGSRYRLFGLKKLISSRGEWWIDKSKQEIFLRLAAGDKPENHVIERKKRDFVFDLTGRSNIKIQGLSIFGASITTDKDSGGDSIGYNADGSVRYPWRQAGYMAPSSRITLDGLDAKYLNHFTDISGHFFFQHATNKGIILSGQDHLIQNCRIQFTDGNGIMLQGRRHRAVENTILDTSASVVDTAAIATAPNGPAEDFEIANNTINRTGRSGLNLRNFCNSDPTVLRARIHHNDVANYSIQDWDAGAFYAIGNDGKFARIDHNRFRIDEYKAESMVFGIYFDFTKNFIADHNLVIGTVTPIQITHEFDHDGAKINNLLIYNNTAITNDGDWGRPLTASTNNGSVIANNLMKVCVFKNPNAVGNVNHWPSYGSGLAADRTIVGKNMIYGDDPAGYYTRAESLYSIDLYTTDLQLVDPAKGDYRPQANSPLVGAGMAVPTVTRDGVVVVPPDASRTIGTFEAGQPMFKVGVSRPFRSRSGR